MQLQEIQTLTREDLITKFKNTDSKDISINLFKANCQLKFTTSAIINFLDDDNTRLVLCDRLGICKTN